MGSNRKIVVGFTGASGIHYGVSLVKVLNKLDIETHLIVSNWAENVLAVETSESLETLKDLVFRIYRNNELDSVLSSSSFLVDGYIVCPATVKTVGQIANSITSNLICRVAENMLRLHKPLVLCLRETPLSAPCLYNLYKLAKFGATILPLSPAFYNHPATLEDQTNFLVGKILDCLGVPNNLYERWSNP